jgi:3-dehydroquinate dehydratase-1
MKPITVRGRPLAAGALPAVCVPLVARTGPALLAEAAAVAAKAPDLIEWRVDFFEGIGSHDEVTALAQRIKQASGGIPLLFTRRSLREGGEPVACTEAQVADLYQTVCAGGAVDLVDLELSSDPGHLAQVGEAARGSGVGLLLSFHDFQRTPPVEELLANFRKAEQLGGDVGKVAVMPRSMADVLTLLQATLQAAEQLSIPVAGMAMGPLGAASRICGGEFGSALTFAVGQQASAPGQLPIDELRAALAVLRAARS